MSLFQSLFQLGDFSLSSGGRTNWKIDCDYLTDPDLEAIAAVAHQFLPVYKEVVPVPPSRGLVDNAERIAKAMRWYVQAHGFTLIVDDVFTTGASMERCRLEVGTHSIGFVVFARGRPPSWIIPMFQSFWVCN